jgi:arylformamidase
MTDIVDISLRLDPGYRMHTPAGVQDVQLDIHLIKDYPGGDGQQVSAVQMRMHHGTHVDSPKHFIPGGLAIDQVPLSTFYGDVVVVDLTSVQENSPILPKHIMAGLGDREIQGTRVLLRTDWNHHYGEPDYGERSPYISPAAVDWLVTQRPVLVGYDYAHAKDAPDTPATVYAVRTFLQNGIVPMGYTCNLDKIDLTRHAQLIAFPLAFTGVEASPVRAVVVQ